jgi:hypothetical protein
MGTITTSKKNKAQHNLLKKSLEKLWSKLLHSVPEFTVFIYPTSVVSTQSRGSPGLEECHTSHSALTILKSLIIFFLTIGLRF